jgi:hypothetical protein
MKMEERKPLILTVLTGIIFDTRSQDEDMTGYSLKLAFHAMLCSGLLVLNSCWNPIPPPNGVVAQTPKAGTVNVPLETNLSLQFAQAMNTASVEAAITFEPLLVCDWSW